LEIRDGYVYINGEQNVLPDRAKLQFFYETTTDGQALSVKSLQNRYHVREGGRLQDGNYVLNLASDDAELLKNNPTVKSLTKRISPKGEREEVFPNVSSLNWNRDNFGPVYIPEEGKTVALNLETLPFYKQIIVEYEKNSLKVENGQIFLNGNTEPVTEYTFGQNYYWMMGDNRHNSEDSRYWGYVPFDHVVGKPVFIWFSWNSDGKGIDKIRWERLFTTVGGSGKAISFFFPFVGLMIILYGINWYRQRKKAA
jgi:signal peptidase I